MHSSPDQSHAFYLGTFTSQQLKCPVYLYEDAGGELKAVPKEQVPEGAKILYTAEFTPE